MSRPTREAVVARLGTERSLLQRYGVRTLSLFGSVARGEAEEDSDVDLVVEFFRPVGFFELVRLKRALEEILGRHVDLATPKSLKPQLRERILNEAVRAA
jgi:uncharacterized protein